MTRHPEEAPEPVAEDDLLRFIDGELDASRRAAVLAYLAARPDEAARVEAYLHQNANLRLLAREVEFGDDPFPALTARLTGKLRRRTAIRRAAAAAAAIVIVSGLGFGGLWMASPGMDTASDEVADNAPGRAHFPFEASVAGADPGETDAAGDELIGWLGGKLNDHSLSKPELDSIGLRLRGGSIISRADTPVIRLVYEDQATKPTFLYAGVVTSHSDLVFNQVPEGHLSLHWRRGPLLFALVAPNDSPKLMKMVELVSDGVARRARTDSASSAEARPRDTELEGALQPAVMPQTGVGAELIPAPRPEIVVGPDGIETLAPPLEPEPVDEPKSL